MKYIYNQTIQHICTALETNIQTGLSAKQAEDRLQKYGVNHIAHHQPPSIFSIFFSQFKDPLIFLLLIASGIIFFVGQYLDGCIIIGILLFNALIGTIQERRTDMLLQGLKEYLISEALVTRDSKKQILENTKLVPGDIVIIKAGEKVPADCRLVETNNFSVDESVLTGEAQAIGKRPDPIEQEDAPLYDQNNMIFQGTYVLTGYATAIVTATGSETQTGKLHKEVADISTHSPLQEDLEKLSSFILMLSIIICSSLFIIGLAADKSIIELFSMLTALFICIVPEGLPLVMTLVLITGAHRMAKKNILVKHLKAIEGLGRANVIVVDKTGTLTKNEMMVSSIFTHNDIATVTGDGYYPQGDIAASPDQLPLLHEIGVASLLLNDTQIEFVERLGTFKIKGDPTQAAATVFAQKLGLSEQELLQQFTIHHTIPFDSTHRYKAVFFSENESKASKFFMMGSPDVIISHCSQVSLQAHQALQVFLSKGLRVVALASGSYQTHPEHALGYKKLLGKDLSFLGFLAIEDGIRDNLKSIIRIAKNSGIKIIMATGDHKTTAQYIADQVGIWQPGDSVITDIEFAKLTQKKFAQISSNLTVCARFSPQDKLHLIQMLKTQGYIVAMTGDGVNDVPSLVASDVSIAMGNIGTELTKQSADIILLQDSFKNIIDAIIQGKNIFLTLRRTILYYLTSNATEVFIMFFSLAWNLPLPLLAAQVLWMNLITDGLLDIALAMEPDQNKTLTRCTSKPQYLLNRSMIVKMFITAIPVSIACLSIFMYYQETDLALARTMTLLTLAMFQWFNAWNCRSFKHSIFSIGLFTNKWLVIASGAVLTLQIALVYAPWLQIIFRTVPISLAQWAIILAVSSSILIIEECRKAISKFLFSDRGSMIDE